MLEIFFESRTYHSDNSTLNSHIIWSVGDTDFHGGYGREVNGTAYELGVHSIGRLRRHIDEHNGQSLRRPTDSIVSNN